MCWGWEFFFYSIGELKSNFFHLLTRLAGELNIVEVIF
jgi:hypothetical protein